MKSQTKRVASHALMMVVAFTLWMAPRPVTAQIAPGVLQSAAQTATISGTVSLSNGTFVSGADVKLIGPAVLSTTTDAHGAFQFTAVPHGTYTIIASAGNLGTASKANLVVNGDTKVEIQYAQASTELRTIANVTTRSAGAHINVTSSSITSVSPSSYAFQGNSSWKNIFAQIPGVSPTSYTSGGELIDAAVQGMPQEPIVLSVNGALPYETSTTLDGMPMQGTSYVENFTEVGGGLDLGQLPMNGFDAADIVRGPGANAPSIVDSIGGSFVLHAPGTVNKNNYELAISSDPYGGIKANAKAAFHFGRLSTTFIFGVNDSPGPAGNASVIDALTATPTTINGQSVHGAVGGYGTSIYPSCYCTASDTLLFCCVPYFAGWSARSGAAALSYQISPSLSAQVFYAGSSSSQDEIGGYFPVYFHPGTGYSGSIAPSPPGKTSLELPDALPPFISYYAGSLLEEKVTGYLGNGVLRLSALQNNTWEYRNNRLANANGNYTLWGTAVVGAGAGTVTPFNGTTAALTFLNEGYADFNATNNRDLLASYALQLGSSSSAGVSYLTSYYNEPHNVLLTINGAPIFGQTVGPAVAATTRETRLHFDTQIGDKLSLGLSWYLATADYHVPAPSAAGGYSDAHFPYSAPRFGAVWNASPNIAIRAAVGGGYALPTLYNLTGWSLSYCGSCVPPQYFETLPNFNLRPETAFGFDVGTDWRASPQTVVSADLYLTNLYGQFYQTQTVGTYNGLLDFITEFGNIGTSRMEGLNLDVHHDVARGYYWRGTLGLTRGYVVSLPAGFYNNPSVPCTLCINQNVIPGPNFNSSAFPTTVPYASASGQIGYRWSRDKFLDLVATYYGNNNIYNTPTGFVEVDGHAGYALTKNVSLLATFQNVTGIYDDWIKHTAPGYAVPVIAGAPPPTYGAVIMQPYGPRAVVLTLDFKS